jgi:hypothetical protein
VADYGAPGKREAPAEQQPKSLDRSGGAFLELGSIFCERTHDTRAAVRVHTSCWLLSTGAATKGCLN